MWPGLCGYGLAYTDVTTGELRATLAPDTATCVAEIGRVEPREVLVPPGVEAAVQDAVRRAGALQSEVAVESFDPAHAAAHRVEQDEEVRRAVGALGRYLDVTRPLGNLVLGALEAYALSDHVIIDDTSFRNLEILQTLVGRRRKGSLLGLLDRTVTAMGARQLRRWLQRPLANQAAIEERLEAVSELHDGAVARDDLRLLLKDIYDIERLGGRIVAGLCSPKDLANLRSPLGGLSRLRSALSGLQAARLQRLAEAMDPLTDVLERLASALEDEPAQSPAEGRVIRAGHDPDVDDLVRLSRSGKDWILEYERAQREQTGIASIKVRFNKVFGYYIEVTKANLHLVPDEYIRKQTIANGERYFTMELKEYESRVLHAEELRVARETELFEALRAALKDEAPRILRTASRVADLDVLCGLAEAAHRHRYVRPTITERPRTVLEGSRHPVVEQALDGDEAFVPNDVVLDADNGALLLITGPNMAGKSTIMRQVALTTLMAQVGSWVPADVAEIGLVDRIFTRVGATDDLSRGQSTFMVEMSETAFILKHATRRSLIILDEIGRGTSTFDGLSIAWAVAEHIHDVGARTMFATHYHELTELARTRERVRNVHVAVREWNDGIVFLRKLQDGGTNRSYGIQVGRLAGLPEPVLQRAREVLATIEQEDVVVPATPAGQLGLFASAAPKPDAGPSEVERALARVEVARTTPLEALRIIDKLQKTLRKARE